MDSSSQIAAEQPSRSKTGNDGLAESADRLAAFHRAFRQDLRRVVKGLPLPPGGRVLDLQCGDGFFTACLARLLEPDGSVVAADGSPASLRLAARAVSRSTKSAPVEYVQADVNHLPFDDATFDLGWCARRVTSFTDPVTMLRELRRVVRPSGYVAVLENGEFHHLLVNWPAGIELAVQRAIAAACRARTGTTPDWLPGRATRRLLREAGLKPVAKRTYTADRQAPFDRATADFLRHHFAHTRMLVAGHLSDGTRRVFDRFTNPDDEQSVFRRADAEVACLNTLYLARR